MFLRLPIPTDPHDHSGASSGELARCQACSRLFLLVTPAAIVCGHLITVHSIPSLCGTCRAAHPADQANDLAANPLPERT